MELGSFQPPTFGITTDVKFERLVSNNIKHIKSDILYIEHNFGELSNKFVSKRVRDVIRTKLENVHALLSVTGDYLSEWESQVQQSPIIEDENFTKLSLQFKHEASKLHKVSELVKQISISNDSDDASTVDTNHSFVDTQFINEAKSDYEDEQLIPLFKFDKRHSETDSLLKNRNEGIKNIKQQIEQAKDIFKDLATIVTIQDEDVQLLEKNVRDSHENSLEVLANLSKSKGMSKRNAWICGISSVALYIIVYCYRNIKLFI